MPRKDVYLDTIERMEPDIAAVDQGAHDASASISLRRIADTLGWLHASYWIWNVIWFATFTVWFVQANK